MSTVIPFKKANADSVVKRTLFSDEDITSLRLVDSLENHYRNVGRPIADILNVNGIFAGLVVGVFSYAGGVCETYYLPSADDSDQPDESRICLQIRHTLAGAHFQGPWPDAYVDAQTARTEKFSEFSQRVGVEMHAGVLAVYAMLCVINGVSGISGILDPKTIPNQPLTRLTGYEFSSDGDDVLTDLLFCGEHIITVRTYLNHLTRTYMNTMCPDNEVIASGYVYQE